MSIVQQGPAVEASASVRGIVGTGAQTFGGDKTFNGAITSLGTVTGSSFVASIAGGTAFLATNVNAGQYVLRNGTEWGIWTNGGGAGGGSYMNFALAGYGGAMQIVAGLAVLSPLGFRGDVAAGGNAFKIFNAGARVKFSDVGTTDYLYSDGANTIVTPGNLGVATGGGSHYGTFLTGPDGNTIAITLTGVPGFAFNNNIKAAAKVTAAAGIGVGNSAAATTPGAVVKKMQVFDTSGNSLGYVPIYDAIT